MADTGTGSRRQPRIAGTAGAAWATTPMTRRDLLLLGTAGVASSLLGARLMSGPLNLAPLQSLGARLSEPFSIGFWTPAADTGDKGNLEIVGANRLRSGDPRFLTDGARVSIHGIYPFDTPEAFAHLEAIDIDVSYAPHHDLAFRAFSYANGVGGASRSTSPAAVTVPVDAVQGMTLNVSYRTAYATEPTRAALRFTTGSEANVAKLREGVYLVALPDAAQSLPDWRSQRVSTAATNLRGINRRDWNLEHAPQARNPYVMLSIK